MRLLACLLAILGIALPLRAQDDPATRPNVVLIITDDQGYGDLGCHGNTMIQTPNLDRLHAESVRWTDYHVDPTCSPTRSALMSGRYSTRTGVWHTIMGRSLMDTSEYTLAEMFRDGGYRTGMFGKWHLGDNYPQRPQDQGFEHVVWHHGGGVGQGPDYWDNDYFDDTYEVNGAWRKFEGYCTDVWFQQATEFIEQGSDKPFFVYLSTNAPHGPFLVDPSWSEPYVEKGVAATMAKFYGMITNIDHNVGLLRKRLDELELLENTLFLFTTDNGTAAGEARRKKEKGTWEGFRAGMRGKKGSEYEGGHRVPFLASWPAGGIEGGLDLDALAAHVDVLPTLRDLCGLDSGPSLPLDGASFAAALQGAGEAPTERTLFVHSQRVEHPQKWRKCAVMRKDWRLINGTELYHLAEDPAQEKNLAANHPERVAELRGAYEAWWTSLEPVFDDYVRPQPGGAENPMDLMSHDWHTGDAGVPWHQNHVRNGYVGNGPWTLDVARPGRYAVTLSRWPLHLERAMDMVEARVAFGSVQASQKVEPTQASATFELQLEAGPQDLRGTLVPAEGEEHGAYFVRIERLAD